MIITNFKLWKNRPPKKNQENDLPHLKLWNILHHQENPGKWSSIFHRRWFKASWLDVAWKNWCFFDCKVFGGMRGKRLNILFRGHSPKFEKPWICYWYAHCFLPTNTESSNKFVWTLLEQVVGMLPISLVCNHEVWLDTNTSLTPR